MSRQELIEHYADQISRSRVIDNAVDALFTAINSEIKCLDVPQDLEGDLFDYINSTFNIS